MTYGGAYGDPQLDAKRLVEEIADVDALIGELLRPAVGEPPVDEVDLFDCMGQIEVELTKDDRKRGLLLLRPGPGSWEAIRAAAHELREAAQS